VTAHRCSLLLVDDEPYLLPTLAALLANDFHVLTADSAESAREVFGRERVDIVLTDQKMPRQTGTQFLEWVRQNHPRAVRLLMSGYAELEDAVEAINRGNVYYYLLKPWRTEELLQVMRNAAEKFILERNQDQLLAELQRLNAELEQRVRDRTRELEMLALTDPLTGLLNRRAIDDVARSELKRHARYHSPLAVGIIDADHFREINRRYLLPGGDQALIGLARTLTSSLRTVDSVGRIGGEEFLVVAPETTHDGAVALAERIRVAVEQSRTSYKGEAIDVTVSLGFAVADGSADCDLDQLRHVAAAALHEAKAKGRNRAEVWPAPGKRSID